MSFPSYPLLLIIPEPARKPVLDSYLSSPVTFMLGSPSSRPRCLRIALDGTAAAGKGTLAAALARHYGLQHLDTGRLYRFCAQQALQAGNRSNEAQFLADAREAAQFLATRAKDHPITIWSDLNAPELRTALIGEMASRIADDSQLRTKLIALQRNLAATPPGAVLDGRDIGSVILPDAEVKFYVDASVEVRAHRRYAEYRAAGQHILLAEVKHEITSRDHHDRNRAIAPLIQAEGSYLLDTTFSDINAVLQDAVHIVDKALLPLQASLAGYAVSDSTF